LFITLQSQDQKIGQGEYEGVTVTSSSQDGNGEKTLMATGYVPNLNAASRFLTQAGFGGNYEEIQALTEGSIEDWLDAQLAMSASWKLQDYVQQLHQYRVDSLNLYFPRVDEDGEPHTLYNTGISDWYFDMAWFQYAMESDDDLRQRVALALSEIFVTSRVNAAFGNNPYALANYYDMLVEGAFGNYRDLIEKVTFHPVMGVYLTSMNNPATDTSGSRRLFPDQNYAREIMQLFSIGLFELNPDGTEKLSGGNPIPTYDGDDIAGLSAVFTGLSWGDGDYFGTRSRDYWSYTVPMKFYAYKVSGREVVPAHEPGPKTFLGLTLPDRDAFFGMDDMQETLDHISNHDNVGPFLSRRLIQRLVTSNPTPAYIGRVAAVFNNNGSGVRGDLGAVVRAILLDKEARDCSNATDPKFGMLREPFLRYMHLIKAMNLTAEGGVYRNRMRRIYDATEQKPMAAQTVFNFFVPDYQPNGVLMENDLVGPEFQLMNSQTLVDYFNYFHRLLIENNDVIDYERFFSDEVNKQNQRPKFNYEFLESMTSQEEIPFLVDYLNVILAHGNMNSHTVNVIVEALKIYDADPDDIAKMAVFLVMVSPDYLINR